MSAAVMKIHPKRYSIDFSSSESSADERDSDASDEEEGEGLGSKLSGPESKQETLDCAGGKKMKKKKKNKNENNGKKDYNAYRQDLKDSIMKMVMDEVLPDIGSYDLDNAMTKKRSTNLQGPCNQILKFFGCLDLTLHETILTGYEQDVEKKVTKICDECYKLNTKPDSYLNEVDHELNQSPLSMAVKTKNDVMVAILLNHNVITDCPDMDTGRYPLMFSILNGTHNISAALLAKGASVNVCDFKSVTPLMLAALRNDVRHCGMLCAKLSDVDAQDQNGWTPLHYAAYGNATKSAHYLVQEGASRTIKDRNKRKALNIARHMGFGETVAVLEDLKSRIAFEMGDED
jgi:ankyrin repeat protein